MAHQYGNSQDIKDLQADIDRLDLPALELITDQAAFVDFTVTGATTGSIATALAAVIANLQDSGVMAAE